MIFTSYFTQLQNLPKNIIPISICGKAPDWYTGIQYKKLAPKYKFFMEWKENKDNDFYIQHFNDEVLDTLSFPKVMQELQLLVPEGIRALMTAPITQEQNWHIALICYEKPEDFCHRHLVADWCADHGVQVTEWKKGDTHERTVTQMDFRF